MDTLKGKTCFIVNFECSSQKLCTNGEKATPSIIEELSSKNEMHIKPTLATEEDLETLNWDRLEVEECKGLLLALLRMKKRNWIF